MENVYSIQFTKIKLQIHIQQNKHNQYANHVQPPVRKENKIASNYQ